MNATALDPHWNPRPRKDLANVSRKAYEAGYSDGYHMHPFNSGQHGDFSDYRIAFEHGRVDAAVSRGENVAGAQPWLPARSRS